MATGLIDVFEVGPDGGWAPPKVLDNANPLQICAAINSDGRLEVIFIDPDNAVYDCWEQTVGGAFLPKAPMNNTAKQIALGQNHDGRLELFFVGMNDGIYHSWQTAPSAGPWQGALLGGQAKEIAIALNADGRLEIFYVGMDNGIYHNWQKTPGSSDWDYAPFRGKAKHINLVANKDGRLELIYIGMDDGLYHNWQTAPNGTNWGGGVSGATADGLGGKAKSITTICNADGRLETFYVGTDDNIYHNWQNNAGGGWHGEASFGGQARQICLGRDADGALELVYVGLDGYIYHNWQSAQNGPWTNWAKRSQATTLASVSRPNGRIAVFYAGSDQPPPPAPIPDELPFQSQIVFGSGIAAGGWTKLVVRRDGTFTFCGHIHDSGAAEYNTSVAFAVKENAGHAYAATHTGKVSGTFEPGSRDDDWTIDSKNDDIATN